MSCQCAPEARGPASTNRASDPLLGHLRANRRRSPPPKAITLRPCPSAVQSIFDARSVSRIQPGSGVGSLRTRTRDIADGWTPRSRWPSRIQRCSAPKRAGLLWRSYSDTLLPREIESATRARPALKPDMARTRLRGGQATPVQKSHLNQETLKSPLHPVLVGRRLLLGVESSHRTCSFWVPRLALQKRSRSRHHTHHTSSQIPVVD